MRAFKPIVIVGALLLQMLPTFADVITNIMSPIASYQYPDTFSGEVLTNGGVMSSIVSYQYYEWPGSDILNLQYSPAVSYYYQLLDAPVLNIISTTRTPTTAESTPAYLISPPPPSPLMAYHGGIFTANLASVDPNQTTIVLAHGWIPLNPLTLNLTAIFTPNGIDDWPTTMAAELHAQNPAANIVAWNWKDAATSPLADPQQAGGQTPQQGMQLGQALLSVLGPNYSERIHFIGHSFGTLVNAYAANFLQGTNWGGTGEAVSPTPWPANNMLMTLFDEAEVGADIHFIPRRADLDALIGALKGQNGNLPSYYHPLPRQFAWAENYISEFGLPHANTANAILTVGSPANAPDPKSWFLDLGSYHEYPVVWYEPTIQTWNSAMGFVWPYLWSLDDPAFANKPVAGLVYEQADSSNPWHLTLTDWNNEVVSLITRLQAYGVGLGRSFVQFANNTLTANGTITTEAGLDLNAIDSIDWIFNLNTTAGGSGTLHVKPHPMGGPGGGGDSSNNPAYVWMQLLVPTNAVSMSFNYSIEGDWQSDSLAAAFNGTNVLLFAGNMIQTSVTFSSGSIDVSAFAGQTNEFFIGIVGGTSTNAQLTVENLAFSVSSPPLLQAQTGNGNLILSWPLLAANFSLQTTTNLAAPNSWVTLTNVPAIVNLQSTITNLVIGNLSFYRLIQSQ
jgi:hypothetical protein